MARAVEKFDLTPADLVDDMVEMADYVRSPEGRAAIEHGLQEIEEDCRIEGTGAFVKAEASRG